MVVWKSVCWHAMRNKARRGPCWSTSLELGSGQPNTTHEAIIHSPRGDLPMALQVEQVTMTSCDLVVDVRNVCRAPFHAVDRNLRWASGQGVPCWVYNKPLV